MEKEQILQRIAKILEEENGKYDVYLDTPLANGVKGLDLNSIEIVTLIVKIEQVFDIIIDFDVLYVTVGDIVNDIHRLIGQKNIK